MTPLTEARVRYIRAGLAANPPRLVKDIAKSLGLDPSYVSRLKRLHINLTERQHIDLIDRWLNVHKIGDIGKRAAEETG